MPARPARRALSPAEIVTAYLDARNRELMDAVITTAAWVARADGKVDPAERSMLIEVLGNSGLLSLFSREEIMDAFERRVRQLRTRGGAKHAFDSLERLAGRSPSRIVIEAGESVARADGRLDARELRILDLIRLALAARHGPGIADEDEELRDGSGNGLQDARASHGRRAAQEGLAG